MKKVFPIIPEQIEVKDYDKNEKVSESMFNVPNWLENKMKEIAEKEDVDITQVSYKQHIFYDKEGGGWKNEGKIIVEK